MSGGVGPGPGRNRDRGRNASGGCNKENNANNERIRVVVRVRPENTVEKAGAFRNVIEVVGEQMLVFDPRDHGSPSFYRGKARKNRDINKSKNRDMKFAFDRVFSSQATTNTVYDNTLKVILDGLLDGYNCSVFAYGATGAGKTHTMLGSQSNPGIIFRTMMDLYQRMDDVKHEKTCDIAVSYLEVYNEQIRDLLMPGNFLPVREDPDRGVVIAGLSLHKPHSAEELMQMLRVGNSNRTQHPTDANAESSRSHAVFQVYVRQRDRTGNTSADWNLAKMSLIDLAGSERATVTKNSGARFREGANINRSLLALGNCINALAEGKSKGYVPYRNSKLTRLLKDSLGGNCRTVMIAAVSPSSMSYEDTYNTLKYADRAKNIKVGLKKNVVSVHLHVSRYVKVIEELRKEVAELKDKLESQPSVNPSSGSVVPAYAPEKRVLYDRLSASLEGVFRGRVEIRKEMLELESSERNITYKIYCKELIVKRVSIINPDDQEEQKCLKRAIESSSKRLANIEKRRLGLQSRMADNESWLQQVMQEVENSRQCNQLAELLDADIRMRHLEVELRDTRRQSKYLKRLSRGQEREAKAMEKLNTLLLQTVYNQYRLIKAHNIAGHQEEEQFSAVQQLTCQAVERSVAWADQSHCPDDLMSTTLQTTPGALDLNSAGNGADIATINNLLDFPILSCVPITPQRKRWCSPANEGNPSQTMRTPNSARRRRRTPRKAYTPTSGSHIPGPNGKASPSPARIPPPSFNDPPHATPKQGFSQKVFGRSVLKDVIEEDDGVFPLQATPPNTAPASGVTVTNDNLNTTQTLNTSPTVGRATVSNGIHGNLNTTQTLHASTAGTATVSNGIHSNLNTTQTLHTSPTAGTASHSNGIYGNLNTTQTLPGGGATITKCIRDNQTITPPPSIAPPAGATVTKCVHGNHNTTPPPAIAPANGATVTKCIHGNHSVTPPPVIPRTDGGTITKCVHGNITPPQVGPSVVRSMDFALCSSPVSSGRSFADALKTPPPPFLRLKEPTVVRSPLASRENLPTTNNHIGSYGRPSLAGCPTVSAFKPGQRIHKRYGNGPQGRPHHPSTDTLQKLGLPSVLDRRKPGSGGNTPGYMKNTKASSRRFKNHPRSTTSEDSSHPARLPRRILSNDENLPPNIKRGLIRSKSVSALSRNAGPR